jgi:molybdopterin-synthase adenylyltransferase
MPSRSEYLSRMAAVPEIGTRGLNRLQTTKVTLVGVGGVGSSAALHLAKAGIGHLRLIDQDIIEPSNLHRLHVDPSRLYHPKAEAIAESLRRQVPWTAVESFVETLRATNALELLDGSDVVVDGLDNFRSRYILNAYSVQTSVPYIFTSAIQNQGHIGAFHPPKTACLECRFQNVVDRPEDSCETLGVTSIITGIVGALAASETIKIALSIPTRQLGRILTIDALVPEIFSSEVLKRDGCPTCGKTRTPSTESAQDGAVVLCGGNTFNVLSRPSYKLDLVSVSGLIPKQSILASTSSVLVYREGAVTVSLFQTGRVLVEGVENREEALRVWREAMSLASSGTKAAPEPERIF